MFNDSGKSKYWEVFFVLLSVPFLLLWGFIEKNYNKLKDYVGRKRSSK